VRLLAVLAVVLLLYLPSLRNTFALDDRLIAKAIRDGGQPNVMVHELQPLARYFTTNYWQGVHERDLLYRPITVLSYALLYAGFGRHAASEAGEALPQHLANLLLHLLAVWLVYLLARAVRLPRAPAVLAALVFGAHAIHSEVVAGVVGRAELLAFDFGALGSLAFVQACRSGHTVRWCLAAALALFVAFAAKESAVAWAPFALVVALVRRLAAASPPRPSLTAALRPALLPWLATTLPPLLLFLALRAATLSRIGADAAQWAEIHERSTAGWRLGNGLVQWAYGLLSSVLPVHLSADHGPRVFKPTTSLFTPSVLGALALLAAVLAAGLLAWRRRPWLFLAVATFYGHSFLTSNVPFRIGTDYAERLYYAPSLGLSFVVGWIATVLVGKPRRVAAVVLALWLSWNGWLIVQRNPVWRDDAALFSAEAENQPRSARMQVAYAEMLRVRGDEDGMARHLERVVEFFPHHAQAWNVLGVHHFNRGRHEDALACLRRSVTAGFFDPGQRVEAAVNLALALVTTGRAAEAVAPLEQALATDPRALAMRVPDLRKRFTAALPHAWFDGFLARLAAAAPAAQVWPYQRAWLAFDQQRLAAAAAHARDALALPIPTALAAEMKVVLAVALASTGQRDEARRLAAEVAAEPAAPAAMRESANRLLRELK
jgi:tetratricopeptide (TPR) repeat protein